MAKRKCNLLIQRFTPTDETDCCFMLWVDDDDGLVGKIRSVLGVASLEPPSHGEMWWRLVIDPRNGVAEVRAEIKALADGKEPRKGGTLDSLRAEARDLGERAARVGEAWRTGEAYLEAADRVHGSSVTWLEGIRNDVDTLCEKRWVHPRLDPQPERELPLHEAARWLGRRAGQENEIITAARALLCAAEETSHAHVGYPTILHLVVDDIVRRLANGKW